MREHSWSINLGRYFGVRVHLHMFFLLFAAFSLYLAWMEQSRSGGDFVAITGASLGILFLSVLAHESSHVVASLRLGGRRSSMTLGPLGGLSPADIPIADPRRELLVQVAGPLVNLFVAASCIAVLQIAYWADATPTGWLGLLHPLKPANLLVGPAPLLAVKLALWINWTLFVANLLPAYPFDGARALRAGMVCLHPHLGVARAARKVAGLAKIAAVVLGASALVIWQTDQAVGLVAIWFALLVLAIFLYFSAKQEEQRFLRREVDDEDLPALLSNAASSSLSPSELAPHGEAELEVDLRTDSDTWLSDSEWLDAQRKKLIERRREIEANEDTQVDEILMRVHHLGMTSLSDQDRQLLERVSARYRRQKQSGHKSGKQGIEPPR